MNARIVFPVALLVGCAATYAPPTGVSPAVSVNTVAPRTEILRATKQVLVAEGYQIGAFDDASGIISTAPREVRVSPEHADCGANVGVENAYLKDSRTRTLLGIGVIIKENTLQIRANIDASYRVGSQMQDMTLICVSRGLLEHELVDKILATLR